MTLGRAALIEIIRRYSAVAVEGATPNCSSRSSCTSSRSPRSLRLKYARNHYGPYADNLRAVLRDIEGHYLEGFGDGSQGVEVSEPFRLLPGAEEAARRALVRHEETLQRIDRVIDLVSGFESSNSLELLASVHWIATHPRAEGHSDEAIAMEVRRWSNRKARLFTKGQVHKALEAMRDRNWVGPEARPDSPKQVGRQGRGARPRTTPSTTAREAETNQAELKAQINELMRQYQEGEIDGETYSRKMMELTTSAKE